METGKQIWYVTLLYFAFGFAWIYFSDKFLNSFPPEVQITLQTYKGWIYIVITTALLYILMKIFSTRISSSHKTIEEQTAIIEEKEIESNKLKELSGELQSANNELSTFNYSISHDIKAPLRAIQGYSELLNEKNLHRMDDEDKEWVEGIRRSVKRIDTLISSLLMFSSVGNKQLNSEKLDMQKMVQNVVSEYTTLSRDKKYHVTIKPLPNCKGDKVLIYQALTNLVGNAFKYSGKVASPEITIDATEENGQIVYRVKDNGAGFNSARAQNLFKPFQRMHSRSQFEGNGVGLAIVERIITRHNGKVWAESSEGQGATFYFTLG